MLDATLVDTAWGLLFILGLRHGLDPDHIAVVDNLTFRAAEERPSLAPWVGTLFALGHSLSVAIIAVGVSWLSGLFAPPAWLGPAVDWLVVTLLALVGVLNLRALLSAEAYRPVGWRQGLIPRALRGTSHPFAIVAIGMIFGLVFDTATQAAAWGAAASAGGGALGALTVACVFAAGMLLTDTLDSQIVARLLRTKGDPARVRHYRRSVGWLIVVLSFGMAAYALAGVVGADIDLSDDLFTAFGVVMALLVTASLLAARRRASTA
jgi:nickel/cobalt transporter (NiCoT) family protein